MLALVLTDTLRVPFDQGPALSDGRAAAQTAEAAGTPADPTRPLTPDDPLRLWIAGDSLAGSLGPSLGAMTAETGVVQPVFDSRISSGLMSTEFFDWPEHTAEELARLQPEAVVFEIGANDAKVLPDDDSWQGGYAQRVDEMMSLLVGNGRDVYWVGVPTMSDDDFSERAREVNQVVQQVAAAYPDVTYVDAYTLFADDDGDYSSSVAMEDGDIETVRADDGVHLTAEGGDLLARAVFYRLDATWGITEQAVPRQAKEVVQTEGSSQVEGTYRPTRSSSSDESSGDSSSDSSNTTTTTVASTTTTSSTTSTSTTTTTTAPANPPQGG